MEWVVGQLLACATSDGPFASVPVYLPAQRVYTASYNHVLSRSGRQVRTYAYTGLHPPHKVASPPRRTPAPFSPNHAASACVRMHSPIPTHCPLPTCPSVSQSHHGITPCRAHQGADPHAEQSRAKQGVITQSVSQSFRTVRPVRRWLQRIEAQSAGAGRQEGGCLLS